MIYKESSHLSKYIWTDPIPLFCHFRSDDESDRIDFCFKGNVK